MKQCVRITHKPTRMLLAEGPLAWRAQEKEAKVAFRTCFHIRTPDGATKSY